MNNVQVTTYLENLPFDELVQLWNEYCGEMGEMDGYIYNGVEVVAEVAPPDDPLWIARAVFFGNVDNWGDYVYFNGYANLVSCWSEENSPIDLSSLADWMIETERFEFDE